jgi:hypothetical protein
MKGVNVAQLFKAMSESSPVNVMVPNPHFLGETYRNSYFFMTDGMPSDDSVWYLKADVVPPAAQLQGPARFYLLTPYLSQGLTVDDITTAIKTGWKMAGYSGGELRYHKETKLLIVVADHLQIETVNWALQALKEQGPKPAIASDSGKPAESIRTEK